jgi:predicted TIM-barrel fold metal-dependent hydrolase
VKRLYFDVSVARWDGKVDQLVRRLLAIGMKRLLYASDGPPLPMWKSLRTLPLTEKEFRIIEKNVAPYLR